MRLKIIRIILVVLFIILGLDLVSVQVLQGKHFYSLSVNNRIRVIPLEGQRGRILDREGQVVADNRLAFNVTVVPQDIFDKDVLFGYLGQVLGIEKEKLLERFHQRRYTPFAPVVIAEDVDKKIAMVLEENKFRFPGLYIQETFRRWYPFGEAAAHVLGYVGKIDSQKIKKLKNYGYTQQSIVGYSGAEEYYDRYLMGKEGGLQIEVNSQGKQVRLLGIRQPERGRDIQLTIDTRMQKEAVAVLEGRKGAIVIMDLDSGEILCLVSSPAYDPNAFSDYKRLRERSRLFVNKSSPMLNRVIKGQYPPGSVFKTILSVAALSEKAIDRETTFFCPGYFKLGRSRFRCAHVHNDQKIVGAIGYSCNVFFYNVGLLVGPETIQRYARMFGLGALTHIDLPAEEKGFVPGPKNRRGKFNAGWYKGDTINYSIGQGELLVTPIQIARMMAAVALNGRMLEPHVLKRIESEEMVATPVAHTIRIRQDVLDIVHEGLRAAVILDHGTARRVDMSGFEIYGKTGTAQTVPGKNTHAWFVGYNLQGKKRIAFCVFLEYGGSSYYAVRTTRNLFKELRKEELI